MDHPSPSPPSYSFSNSTFPQFPYLPKELRLRIWEYSLSPRVIPVHRSNERLIALNHSIAFMTLTTRHQCLNSIPNACAESLAVFKKSHVEWRIWDFRNHAYKTAYDPLHDIVFFSNNVNHWFLIDFAEQYPRETRTMRILALPSSITKQKGSSATFILEALLPFVSLRELIVVSTERNKNVPRVVNEWLSLGTADSVRAILERLKLEKWPEWNLPAVRAVESHFDILHDS